MMWIQLAFDAYNSCMDSVNSWICAYFFVRTSNVKLNLSNILLPLLRIGQVYLSFLTYLMDCYYNVLCHFDYLKKAL